MVRTKTEMEIEIDRNIGTKYSHPRRKSREIFGLYFVLFISFVSFIFMAHHIFHTAFIGSLFGLILENDRYVL